MISTKCTSIKTLLGLSLLLTACGGPQYQSIATTSQSLAPGSFTIAPKVDVLMVEGDTGSMAEAYSSISTQTKAFLTNLDSQNWNYHFATVPMTTDQVLSQATASKQDSNWGSLYIAPYPGAQEPGSGDLSSSVFRTLNNYSGFVQYSNISNSNLGANAALANLSTALSTRMSAANFIRPDAMLAIVFVTNKNDDSYVNYCYGANGSQYPCDSGNIIPAPPLCDSSLTPQQSFRGTPNASGQAAIRAWNAGNCGNSALTYNYYSNLIGHAKSNSQSLRVFSAVAGNLNYSQGCLGGNSSTGTRFQQLASSFGGKSYDVCTQSVTSVLADIQSNLSTTFVSYHSNFALIGQTQPDPNTMIVQKYIGGDPNNAVTIPKDPTNGYEYIGYQTEYLVNSPVQMNQETGFMIQLNGSAELNGNDVAYITYKTPTGASGHN